MPVLTLRAVMRARAVVPVAALALLAAAPAPRALDGYIVTQRITMDSPQAMSMTMRIKVAQGHVRLELDSPELAQMGSMYMLTRDDGRITTVMPSQGMAVTMDASMIGGQGMGAMALPTISDVTATVDDLGAGERLLGYATHKYRVHTTYKMATAGAAASNYDTTMEMYVSTEVPGLADGLQKFTESFGGAFSGIAGGGSKDLAASLRAKMPKGYTLKMSAKSIETTASGETRNSTFGIEVTEISRISIEASEFEVPAGIQVMDLGQMMWGRGGR
jgi:hypothetical protein